MKPIKIFISSVQREFADERQWLCDYIRQDALLGKFFSPFIFEELPAADLTVQEAYLTEVAHSDIYIGILGDSYGFEDAEGISPTEREYDKATAELKYRLIFIRKTEDSNRAPKQQKLIAKAESAVVRKSFVDYEELRSGVYAALVHYLEQKEYLRILPFDATLSRATMDDIDEDKIREFVHIAGKHRGFPLPANASIERILTHLDLIAPDRRLANAAVLLFGKQPQKFFISSEVKCAQFYGNNIAKPIPSYQVYRGDVFQLITQAVDFVMSRIDARVGSRDTSIQVDVEYELPLAAVTEAIVNAIAHRDYSSNGSVQVMLFKNRLEIWNPGMLPVGLTVEKLREPHSSRPANPLLANPMYLAGSIERMGTGTGDIIAKCEEAGLTTPVFIQDEEFKVILWRLEDKTEQATEQATEQLDKKVLKLIQILDTPRRMSEIQTLLKLKHRPTLLYNYLHPAINGGFVVSSHPDNPNHPNQTYMLTEKGRKVREAKGFNHL